MDGVVTACFHCGEPCPPGLALTVERDGQALPVCCAGCQAVAELIEGSGLGRYYRFRQGEGRKADENLGALGEAWRSCDERSELWGTAQKGGAYDLLLQTEGVHCAACAWLIRSRLEPLAGVERVQVDIGSGYTRILWRPETLALSTLALALAEIGYRPHLPLAEDEERGRLRERRDAMLRLGVAGLGMMQVMMYAVGLYAGEAMGISAGAERFLEWTSLLVTIPVLFYAGRPFFDGALASLRARRIGMDVPVALALTVAFTASCWHFLRGEGEVYFDSVVMFIFFLSAARYVQLVQRHRNLQSSAALARLLPEWAQRIEDGELRTVLLADLAPGDQVRVPVGEPFPADGILRAGHTEVDEALLTGESRWLTKGPGDSVVGGSLNQAQPVDMEVTASGGDSTVSALGRLLLTARSQGSEAQGEAEKLAGYFIATVLAVAALTGLAWSQLDPGRVLPTVLAVLVVSCPCALSLATPAALAAASRGLLRAGVLLTRSDALETLARADLAVFDKTGTLTLGEPERCATVLNPDHPAHGMGEEGVLALAAGLEGHSAHPLARAFRDIASPTTLERVREVPHGGLEGHQEGARWRLGKATFVGAPDDVAGPARATGGIWLGDDRGWLARFELDDALRPGSADLVPRLAARGLGAALLSGDMPEPVARVAKRVGMDRVYAAQSPQDKMRRVGDWQAEGHRVLMVGDGVNDAPVLAAADVSMTVQGATELANSAADLIVTGRDLNAVPIALDQARRTRRLVRQNLAWALGYNALALPLAVLGLLQPWMAALGMSASSLLVVANASRLSRLEPGAPRS